jgi:hypothetical protein
MPAPVGFVRLIAPQPWPSGERISHGAWSAEPWRDPENPNRHLVDVPEALARHFASGGPAGFVVLDEDV